MSRLVAHTISQPELTACALFPARAALSWPASDARAAAGAGWGLGFVQGEEVLLQKNPRARSGIVDFYNLTRELRSDALIGRIILPGAEDNAADSTGPYRFRTWLFGMTGDVVGFEPVRERLLHSIPDFLRRNIHGRSAGEHIFHLFLAFLHDAGALEIRTLDPMVVHHALEQSGQFLNKLLDQSPDSSPRLTLIATNGRVLVVECQRLPTQFLALDGIPDCTCPVCSARRPTDDEARRVSYPDLRVVVIESDTELPRRYGWTRLPEVSALIVGMDRIPHVVSHGDAAL